MKVKKNAPAVSQSTNSQVNNTTVTPREKRVFSALLESGLTFRDVLDTAPCNSVYSFISTLRSKYGLTLPTTSRKFTTVDGNSGRYVIYQLSESDRRKVKGVLNAAS